MRVLVLAKDFPSAVHPDAGLFVLRQVQALTALGHEALVVRVVPYAPNWTAKWRQYRAILDRDSVENIPVRTLRAFIAPRMIGLEYLPLQVDGEIRRIIDAFRPDLVHGHFLIPSGQLAVRYGLPSILTVHGSDAYDWAKRRPGLRRAATEAIKRATTVVAVSDFVRAAVRTLFDRPVDVAFNGADERFFTLVDRAQARPELGLPNDRFIVSFAGLAVAEKGVFVLIDALAALGDLRPLLLLAGPRSSDERLAAYCTRRQIDARFFGTVPEELLARVVTASDVFCLPSYLDGLPVHVCEAMLSARPVVATAVGGIPEIVVDGETGFLVPPGDPAVLAERLRTIATDPELGARMGESGHAAAKRRLTWRANASAYDELYRRTARGSV